MRAKTLQTQIAWLMAIAMLAVMLLSVALLRYLSSASGAEQAAKLAYLALNQVASADGANVLDRAIRMRVAPPLPARHAAAFLRRMEDELVLQVKQSDQPERKVVLSRILPGPAGPRFVLWLEQPAAGRYLGVVIEPERERLFWLAALWLALLGMSAWLLARWLARRITAPLSQLSAQAPALVSGQALPELKGHAPMELLELSDALQDAAGRHAQVGAERELMLLGVSHDLRTPIARLRMALELQESIPAAERTAMLEDLSEMEASIAGVLSQSREGTQEPSSALVLAAVLRQLIRRRHAPWQLSLQSPALESLTLSLPWNSVRRVLSNLLDNAEQHGAQPLLISLCQVTDAALIRIRNQRSDSRPAGFGMGLTLAMRLAARFQGKIAFNEHADFVEVDLQIPLIEPRPDAR
jgi:two-component system, OmpR family, osmolarity sensor histidine kinase EnvZ